MHPFTGGTHPTDVRLTTRISEENLSAAVFGTIHECGHGLYEQGFRPEDYRTVLAQAPSMGLHESQSRLWENLVGRSLPFWRGLYPRLQANFPAQLSAVPVEAFHAALNRVSRSPIRVEADEVTYNLHIVLRTELELELLRGNLPASELPGAWKAFSRKLLGLEPADDVKGVLQDIHWAWGELGYFPTYALGNLYAASFMRAAERALPALWEAIARGDFLPLRSWLRTHVHAEGARLDAEAVGAEGDGTGPHRRGLRRLFEDEVRGPSRPGAVALAKAPRAAGGAPPFAAFQSVGLFSGASGGVRHRRGGRVFPRGRAPQGVLRGRAEALWPGPPPRGW